MPANVNLGSSYSTHEIVGAFTFTNIGADAATPYAALSSVAITLNAINSANSRATTTVSIINGSTNQVLVSGNATLGSATNYLVGVDPSMSEVPQGGSLTLYVYANTAINGINVRPVGSNSQIIMNTALTNYTWTDGTRTTGISPNPYPANSLPITSGSVVVASLMPESTALTANILNQLTNILNQLALLLK